LGIKGKEKKTGQANDEGGKKNAKEKDKEEEEMRKCGRK
jgi:hypothetical protein